MSERDNVRRWPVDRRGVYEVWYTTWNDPRTRQGYWLRFIAKSPTPGHPVPGFGDAPFGELWFARFDPAAPQRSFGIHRRSAAITIADAPFRVTIDGCVQTDASSVGQLAGNGHEVRWDLRWEPGATMCWYPDAFYKRPIAESTALSPNPRVPLSGRLVVDGEEIVLDRVVAGQSHVWGKKHAYAWLWAHCSDLPGSRDTTLEIVAGRMQKRGVVLPVLGGISLVLDGEELSLNSLSHIVRNKFDWSTGRARFRGSSLRTRIEGELSCRPEDMVNAPYMDPDGQGLYCANTCTGDLSLRVWKRSGLSLAWREHRHLQATGRAHFEMGSRERDPRVTTPHVLVT